MYKRFLLTAICFMGVFSLGFTLSPNSFQANITHEFANHTFEKDTLIDHHTHIFSPEVSKYLEDNVEGVKNLPPLGVEQLMKIMERDSVKKAVILSNAYFFSDSAEVSAENDRVAEAVSEYPERTIGFFGVNPLSDSAIGEIERNATRDEFAGIKLHLANSGVDLQNPDHAEQLADIFKKANSYDLGIVIHMRYSDESYGKEDARIFVDEVLSQASDIPIQIAHMAGWSGYDKATDQALGVFADRIAEGELSDQVYFDLSAVIKPVPKNEHSASEDSESGWYPQKRYDQLTKRLRTIGMDRILFGTDWPEWMPAEYKSDIRKHLPLTESELQTILSNRAPWIR